MKRSNQRGLTLLELLTALLITGVLVTLAVPGYQSHRLVTERVQAAQALQGAQRCFTARQALRPNAGPEHCLPANTRSYRFLYVPSGDTTGPGHEWRAEPLGRQREDGCGTLALDHLGEKKVLGASLGSVRCWRGRR